MPATLLSTAFNPTFSHDRVTHHKRSQRARDTQPRLRETTTHPKGPRRPITWGKVTGSRVLPRGLAGASASIRGNRYLKQESYTLMFHAFMFHVLVDAEERIFPAGEQPRTSGQLHAHQHLRHRSRNVAAIRRYSGKFGKVRKKKEQIIEFTYLFSALQSS